MDYMTMRLMFPRDAVLGLLEEAEFEDCMTLVAQRDVNPVPDVYLAVFVLQAEPVPECGQRLHPVSTTIIGITRTSSRRLIGEALFWADTKPDSPAMDILRAHFRAEEAFVNKAVNDIGYRLPYWRNHCRNGAGDLNTVPEITIEDRGAAEMQSLFGPDLKDP
jgi:hypothetical protein